MPFPRCPDCGKRVEHCECPEADDDDKDFVKLCKKCGEHKAKSDFYPRRGAKCGTSPYCRPCESKRASELYQRRPGVRKASNARWYAANRDETNRRSLDGHYQRNYGISRDDFLRLIPADRRCPICSDLLVTGKASEQGTAVLDHCHKTRKIRGVICRRCNIGLGCFRDNSAFMAEAIKYLEMRREGTQSEAPALPQAQTAKAQEGPHPR